MEGNKEWEVGITEKLKGWQRREWQKEKSEWDRVTKSANFEFPWLTHIMENEMI